MMKIAIPVKMNQENPAVAPLFGKAKWFAIVQNNEIEIVANENSGGQAVVEWLANLEVDTILIQEMGRNPYNKVKSYDNMEIYHVGFERILLKDVMEKFNNDFLIKVDNENMESIIKHHEKRHPSHEHTHA